MKEHDELPNPNSRGNVGDASIEEIKEHYKRWGKNTDMNWGKKEYEASHWKKK